MRNAIRLPNRRAAFCLLCAVMFLNGCTASERSQAVVDLTTALSNLVQNKTLAEQLVGDVKSVTNPSTRQYQDAQESYQIARRTYDRYLDALEMGSQTARAISLPHTEPEDVQNDAADFFAEATLALKPNAQTRHIRFQRAVIVPSNLMAQFDAMPKKSRDRIISHFDKQVRWRSWGEIEATRLKAQE